MILVAILCTPLVISGLFAGALLAIWRRRREATHAMSWGAAFAAIMVGWLSVLGTTFILNVAPLPGATPSLCWLAAALLLVHGLRQRGGRPDRAAALGAIWTGIALSISLLTDLVLASLGRQIFPWQRSARRGWFSAAVDLFRRRQPEAAAVVDPAVHA